jgi:hypothetical protein
MRESLPEKIPSFKLEQPPVAASETFIPITPKHPSVMDGNSLYTDPKLLDMIKKDL